MRGLWGANSVAGGPLSNPWFSSPWSGLLCLHAGTVRIAVLILALPKPPLHVALADGPGTVEGGPSIQLKGTCAA